MKKLLLGALFLLIVSLISAKAFVSLFGYQAIEELKSETELEASIAYSWMSSDFGGQIHFHDVVITPFRLKQSYNIETLSISYGSLPSLIFGLMDLKNGLWKGIESISLSGTTIPTTEGGLLNWLANEYDPALLVPLHAYACDKDTRLSAEDWKKMGIDTFKLDLNLSLQDINQSLTAQTQINLNELGVMNIALKAKSHSISPSLSQLSLLNTAIESFEVEHIENGFFRRLGNFCTAQNNMQHDVFATQAAAEWRNAMAKIGIIFGPEIEQLYSQYLIFGGKAALRLDPSKPLLLAGAKTWLDMRLSEQLGISLTLNDQQLQKTDIFLKGDYYRPAPVVVEKAPEKPKEIPKAFYPIEWDALFIQENQRVRIHLTNDKVIEGMLDAKTEFKLSVIQSIEGGLFTVHPRKSDIQLIEIWR